MLRFCVLCCYGDATTSIFVVFTLPCFSVIFFEFLFCFSYIYIFATIALLDTKIYLLQACSMFKGYNTCFRDTQTDGRTDGQDHPSRPSGLKTCLTAPWDQKVVSIYQSVAFTGVLHLQGYYIYLSIAFILNYCIRLDYLFHKSIRFTRVQDLPEYLYSNVFTSYPKLELEAALHVEFRF